MVHAVEVVLESRKNGHDQDLRVALGVLRYRPTLPATIRATETTPLTGSRFLYVTGTQTSKKREVDKRGIITTPMTGAIISQKTHG